MKHSVPVRLNKELYDFVKSYAQANGSSMYEVLSSVIDEWRDRLPGKEFNLNDLDVDLDDLFEPEGVGQKGWIEDQGRQQVKMRFTTSEKTKSAIKKLAKENYTSVNKYLDIFLTNHIEDNKVRFTEKELRLLHKYNSEVRAIGRNLNQITKHINSGKLAVLDENIVELIKKVNDKIKEYGDVVRDIVIKNGTN